MKLPSARGQSGFTLLEVLISLTIVALCVTVFFQLFSSGMKLEFRSRQKMGALLQAQQLFTELQTLDAREDDFPWQGQDGSMTWELDIQPGDVQSMEYEEGPVLHRDTELYTYVFRFAVDGSQGLEFRRLVAVPKNFFPEEFKREHLE